MKWLLFLPAIILLSVIDYFYIKRKSIIVDKKIKNIRGLLPSGWKQWSCFICIPLSLLAVAWMISSYYLKPEVYVLKRVCVVAVLWPIAVSDFREYRIPNKLVLLGLALRVPLLVAELFVHTNTVGAVVVNELMAAAASAGICLVCMLLSRGSLGMGDLKLVLFMSAFLGTDGILASMFVSVFFSAVCAIGLLLFKKKSRKDAIPFAPFVLVGTIVSIILTGV